MIHTRTVTPQLLKVAQQLSSVPELADFRIVGGTAIALQLGHRKSVDIDFFTNDRVDRKVVRSVLTDLFPSHEFTLTEHSISFVIDGVRVELFDDWDTPFLEKPILDNGLRLASLNDLAALKLDAITGRRDKKDYVDLYVLFKSVGASNILQQFKSYNPNVSMKSILFALDEVRVARDNKTIMPEMLTDISWKAIEKSMVDAAREFLDVPPK